MLIKNKNKRANVEFFNFFNKKIEWKTVFADIYLGNAMDYTHTLNYPPNKLDMNF